MKDFPFFNTDNGIASLTLKEIPYTSSAYIKILDSQEPEKLLEECIDFCKFAGAEKIFAANHCVLEKYPVHTRIYEMSRMREGLSDTDASLFPVTEQTLAQWRSIYNERMCKVPNFSYMSILQSKKLLQHGGGYFVHRDGILLGIGIASGERIDGVISLQPGGGEAVILALNYALGGERMILNVASENKKAMALYERMGFIITAEIDCWHQIE